MVTRYWYALVLSSLGRFEDAEIQIARGFELEPLSSTVMHGAMMNSVLGGRYAEAIERGIRGIENDPHYFLIRTWLGLAYEMTGEHREAIQQQEKAVELCDRSVSWVTGSLGHAYGTAGDRARAEEILKKLLDLDQRGSVDPYGIASVYLGLGDRENALRCIERAAETRGLLPVMIKGDPRYKSLHSEPRYQAALRKLNLFQ